MKQYAVEIDGIEHTMQLDEDDAKTRFPDAKVLGSGAVEDKAVAKGEAAKKTAAKRTDKKG